MGSIETSDGGSLRVLGLVTVGAAVPGTADGVTFHGAGVSSAVVVGQGETFVVDLTYDGPAGIDQLEWVGVIGQAPNSGLTQNQLPSAMAPTNASTFRVYLSSHNGAVAPQAIAQGAFIAIWRNKGGLIEGTVVIPPN